jgi:hypothetical protein
MSNAKTKKDLSEGQFSQYLDTKTSWLEKPANYRKMTFLTSKYN